MGIIGQWYRTSSPIVKVLMGISIISAAVVGHRMYYAPYVRRQRHRRAEEWANMIIQQEESNNQPSEH